MSNTISPVILTTWNFGLKACRRGYLDLLNGSSALDAVENAANVIESDSKVHSVGYGGLPNANGIVELDAAIMDGASHSAGSVAGLTCFRNPISVARAVMEQSGHTMLVGDNAHAFALDQGFFEEDTTTPQSRKLWKEWVISRERSTVAHFDDCPSSPFPSVTEDHDTIGLCALDQYGNLAAGCTTSGMAWKLPGRVGDSPIIGSGLYVDNEVGAAAATGHGDEIMKACLSYRVVVNMSEGLTPQEACEEAIEYMIRKRPPERHHFYSAALIALGKDGSFGAAATLSGFESPDRLWEWAAASAEHSKPKMHEGSYVSLNERLVSLLLPAR